MKTFPTNQPTADLSPLKILIADDSRVIQDILFSLLTKLGHSVTIAENGKMAIELYNEIHPDLVLMDVIMPEMGGLEAIQQIKAQHTEHWVPIIILTSLNSDADLLEGLNAGADDYLTKPIKPEILVAKIRSIQRIVCIQNRTLDLANNDQLTKLPNRHFFYRYLYKKVQAAKRKNHGLSILLVDLDGFKPINDSFGHDAGDIVLRTIGVRLKQLVGTFYLAARLGGDEFIIVIPQLTASEKFHDKITHFASNLIQTINQPISFLDLELQVGASVGIAFLPEHAHDMNDLIKCADDAMYKAKQQGKNQFVIFHSPEQ